MINEEIIKLTKRVRALEATLTVCKTDFWFMTNLLEKYSTDKDQAIRDCIERMKFRKPIFDILKESELSNEGGKNEL